MAPHPLLNKPAPSFTALSSDGTPYTVQPGRGRPLAIFFFPGNNSVLCTRQSCSFRDDLATNYIFKRTGVEIIGVSCDDVDIQSGFVQKHGLKYPMLSDKNGGVKKVYSVGKGPMNMLEARMTFFIDARGVVRATCDTFFNSTLHSLFLEKWLYTVDEEKTLSRAFIYT